MNKRGAWQLILMAREGDRSAIDSLFFSSFPSAYLILLNITGNKDTALKILSDVYINVFSSLDSIESSEEFSQLVHKQAYEKVSQDPKYKESLKQDKTLCEKAELFSHDSACFYDFDSVRSVEDTASTADCIFTVLKTLSLEKRICLYLYYFVSTSFEVIASVVSASEEQVKGVLAAAFSEAVPLLKKVCEKSDVLNGVNEKSVILWAVRNSKEFSLSPEEIDVFYPELIKSLVESSVLDASMASSSDNDSGFEMRSMQLTSKKNNVLKSIFNLRNLIILLIVAVTVGLVFTMNKLGDYNERRQEREALTSRTTLRYRTTAPSSERVIFSTEYSYPEIDTEPVSETQENQSTEPVTEESPDASTTNRAEKSDFSYIESGGSVTITGYNGEAINITVPEKINGKTVTTIGENAFFNSDIVNINLPSTVTTIGKNAFHSCAGLQAIKLPIGVTSIGSDAFRDCTNLGSVSLPATLTKIGSQAFYKCSSLKAIALPSTLASIGDWAFAYCSSLANITIPKSVSSVGASVFYECSAMTRCTFESSSKVVNLGESFFFDCSSLEAVTLPQQVKVIPMNCFYGCKALKSVSLTTVTHINESAFEGCSSLTSVGLSTSLLKIEKSAFSGCSSLREVKIPSNTLSLGEKAFSGCKELARIYIPASVTRIGDDAFRDCENIVIECPENSFAEAYASKNNIQLYGKDSSANET